MSDLSIRQSRNKFIELRAQKMSLKKISKKLDIDIKTLKSWENLSELIIRGKRARLLKEDEMKSLGIHLKTDIDHCDKLLKSIEKQVKTRGVGNLATIDLLRFSNELLKIKTQKLELLSKTNI